MTMKETIILKALDLARYHFEAGRLEKTDRLCRKVLSLDAAHAETRYLLSLSLSMDQRWVEAVVMLKGLAADFPELPMVVSGYLFALEKSQLVPEGIMHFEQLCSLHPDLTHLRIALGKLYGMARRENHAQSCFKRVLEREPVHTQALFLLGKSLAKDEHWLEAETYLRLASDLEPERSGLLDEHALALKLLGRTEEASVRFQKALDLNPGDAGRHDNFLVNSLCVEQFAPEHVFRLHLDWAARFAQQRCHQVPYHKNLPDPARRLRIGYVSADFRSHPVAYFIEPILSLHDRSSFDIFCYAHIKKPDFVTEQLRRLELTWRQTTELDDAQLSELIQKDSIDILIDLGSHTASSRLLVFASKPAPVQVTWLGYPHSTGLTSIDYRISDCIADPPGMTEHIHSETLFRLQSSFICYNPPQGIPEVLDAPFLHQGFITFGVFNHLAKWNPSIVMLWAQILLRVANSRLLIKTSTMEHDEEQRYLAQQFAILGVATARLIFIKRLPTVLDHLRAIAGADIALDTFPYNGTTTTCETLIMGVPVISLSGDSHISRVGASILAHSGLHELVADTRESYVEKAVALALAPDQILAYRRGLRAVMARSPFLDVHGFTRRLEAGYRKMWETWCSQRKGV